MALTPEELEMWKRMAGPQQPAPDLRTAEVMPPSMGVEAMYPPVGQQRDAVRADRAVMDAPVTPATPAPTVADPVQAAAMLATQSTEIPTQAAPVQQGPQLAGYTVQSGLRLPGVQKQADNIAKTRAEGVTQQVEAWREQGAAQAEAAKAKQVAAEDFQAWQTQRQAQMAEKLDKEESDYNTLMNEVRQDKESHKGLWESRTPFQKALMAIGLGMGAWGGGVNPAMEIIKQVSEEREKGFQAKRQGKLDAINSSREKMNMIRARYGDDERGQLAIKSARLEAIGSHLEELVAKTKDKEAQAKGQEMLAQIGQEKMNAALQLAQLTQARVSQQFATPRGESMSPEGMREQRVERSLYVPAAGGNAPTAEEAQKLRAVSGSVENIQALAEEASKLRDDPKAFIPGTDAHARLKGIQGQITLEVKTAGELGALSGPDMGIVEQIAGKVAMPLPGVSQQLKSMSERAYQGLQKKFRNVGIEKVERGYADDGRGNMVPVRRYTGETNMAGEKSANPVKRTPVK